MVDPLQIDPAQLKAEAVQEAQQALIDRLTGGKKQFSWQERGKEAPETYDELFDEVKKQVPTITQDDIDRRVEEKLAEKEKAREAAEQAKVKQQETEVEKRRSEFDREWYDLVKEGKMPEVASVIQERINKGETLTLQEIEADEGLKARLELAKVSQGKSAKLAFYEDYGKEPAGAHAPVLGNRPATPQQESQELDYERDVKPTRKKIFGY